MKCEACGNTTNIFRIKQITGMGAKDVIFAAQYKCCSCLKLKTYQKYKKELTPEELLKLNLLGI